MRERGKALLFERCAGSRLYPLLINAFGSMERCAIGFGVDGIREHRRQEALVPPRHAGLRNLADRIKAIPRLRALALIPAEGRRRSCREVVEEEPDLSSLPSSPAGPETAASSPCPS